MNYEERDTFGMYKAGPSVHRGPAPEMMGADTLVGNDVCNHKGEHLGDIKEIMLDMRSGRVAYAVLSLGTSSGWERSSSRCRGAPSTPSTSFVPNVEKERLKSAPGFDKDEWPNIADQSWAREIHSYY